MKLLEGSILALKEITDAMQVSFLKTFLTLRHFRNILSDNTQATYVNIRGPRSFSSLFLHR